MEGTIEIQQTKNGSTTYVYCEDSKKVPLNSVNSPEKEMERFIKEIEKEDAGLNVIIGVGNGLVIEKLIQSIAFKNSAHTLVFEPFIDVRLSENVTRIFLENEKELSFSHFTDTSATVFTGFLQKFTGVKVHIFVHPNYVRSNKAKIEDVISKLVGAATNTRIFNNTEKAYAVDWILEPLLNIRQIAASNDLKTMENKYAGETALLISAGPSLQENMPFVKRMQEHAHIFAVGPTLRPLQNNHIIPDFVLSIDSSEVNFQSHFKGLEYEGNLIYGSISKHKIQENHKGRKIACRMPVDYITSLLFKELNKFEQPAPSIAVFTLLVIKLLGFKQVFLVGQDLALINGEYYSTGIKGNNDIAENKLEITVENNNGGTVQTSKQLKLFLDYFESNIENFPPGELKIFNTSKFGAKIKGTDYVDPRDVTIDFKKKKIEIKETPLKPNKEINTFIRGFIQELEQLKKDSDEAKEKVKELLKKKEASSKQQKKILKMFMNISNNTLFVEVLLGYLSSIFQGIINRVAYSNEKEAYSYEDFKSISSELLSLYSALSEYIELLLKDPRTEELKKEIRTSENLRK